jgi:hypothetical protein
MKVFGIGLNKTGTKTLGACFRTLGLRNRSFDPDLLECYFRRDFHSVFNVADQYDSFEDWPWPLMYREFDENYPDAKFILTIRKDPETWFNSLCRHALRTGPTRAREIAYGYQMPMDNPECHLTIYNNHNQSVIDHFSGRPEKLLVINWEARPSWELICNFLGYESIPQSPIPHENKSPEEPNS